jgi:WD40 repeat protein
MKNATLPIAILVCVGSLALGCSGQTGGATEEDTVLPTPPPSISTEVPQPTATVTPESVRKPLPQPTVAITLDNASELVELSRWEVGPYPEVQFSPDGSILAIRLSEEPVQLWRMCDGQLLNSIHGNPGNPTSFAFSWDGSTVAVGARNKHLSKTTATSQHKVYKTGRIELWRISDWTLTQSLVLAQSTDEIAFSPDDKTLASVLHSTVDLWHLSDGRIARSLVEQEGHVRSLAFSPNENVLATGSYGRIGLWCPSDGKLLRSLEGHSSYVNCVSFSPDG